MATRSRTAGCHAGVIEGRRVGETRSAMTCAAIRIRRDMRERAEIRFANGDAVIVALHARMPGHFGTAVIESAAGKRRCRWRIRRVTVDAIARCRYVIDRLPGCCHPVMTCRARQAVIGAPGIQCRVVEARRKGAAGLMALLTRIRRCGVRWAFANGAGSIARDMTTYALLRLNGRVLVIDRIGFQEIAGRRMARITVPAVGINGGVHGIAWVRPGGVDRVVV